MAIIFHTSVELGNMQLLQIQIFDTCSQDFLPLLNFFAAIMVSRSKTFKPHKTLGLTNPSEVWITYRWHEASSRAVNI